MTEKPIVSIVLGAYNRLDFLKLAIQSAREETEQIPHEIIVVDGGSDDGSLEWLALQKDVITIIQYNRGEFNGKPIPRRPWGYFMNLGFKSAQADYILMMSDDTIFHPNAVQNAMTFIRDQQAQGKKVGAVPFYFHDIGHDPAHYYKVFTLFGKPVLNHGIYLKDAFRAVDFADDAHFQFYASDSDICFKLLHAGYEVLPCETALMLHCPNHPTRYMTTSDERWAKDMNALLTKWRGIFVDEAMTIHNLDAGDMGLTFVDAHGLANRFNSALAVASQTQDADKQATGKPNDILLVQMESRLNNILSKVNYLAQIEGENERRRIEWSLFWEQWKAFNRPYYRRMLSHWVIFAPFRAIKNRFIKSDPS